MTRRPFHADVAFAMSSPTFFGDFLCNGKKLTQPIDLGTHETERTDFRG